MIKPNEISNIPPKHKDKLRGIIHQWYAELELFYDIIIQEQRLANHWAGDRESYCIRYKLKDEEDKWFCALIYYDVFKTYISMSPVDDNFIEDGKWYCYNESDIKFYLKKLTQTLSESIGK